MAIVRFDPLGELAGLRTDMDRLMSRIAGSAGESRLPRRWAPAANVIEQDDHILITAELPGVKDEDVEVTVQDGMLRISGERRLEDEVKDEHYHRIERSYGGFERTFPLPPGVSEKDIRASTAYGVLRVAIPKPKTPEPKRIEVKSGD